MEEKTTVSLSPFSEKCGRRWSREQDHLGEAGKQPPHPIRVLQVRLIWQPGG